MRVLVLLIFCACFLPAAEQGEAPGKAVHYEWKDAQWLTVLDGVSRQMSSPLFVDSELCNFLSQSRVTMDGTAKDWPEVMTILCTELGKQMTKNEQFSLNEGETVQIQFDFVERKGGKILTLQRHVVKPK